MTSIRLWGRAYVDGAIREQTLVTVSGGQIATVEEVGRPADATVVRGVIAPGFIDVHVHGGDGADFMDGGEEANARILRHHARHGTTALAATTLSASHADLVSALAAVRQSSAHPIDAAAEIVAVHLEGPYINPRRAGAQDRESIRAADGDELALLIGQAPDLCWIVTIAPEIDGALGVIERFRDRVRFSIGHTDATYGDAVAALAAGASHFTHLFNAMTPLEHRAPGAVGAALESADATAELIADGIHVHRAALRIAATSMPRRIALVTDAMRACGLPDGSYRLYGYDVDVADGAARLADGTLAGSVLTMDAAVRNAVELAGLPLEMALACATDVPARIAGVRSRKGRIAPGWDADLVVLDEKLAVERVFARGVEVA